MLTYRQIVLDLLIPYFEQDDRYHVLLGDMGFGASDLLAARFPHRITNCGVMEQGMVGVAAGMAIGGMIPIVYSMPNFLCIRALEQIRNDIVLQGLKVKLIGTGAGQYLSHLGKSHCGGDLDINLMNLVGMPVFDGVNLSAGYTFEHLVGLWLTDTDYGYLRV